MRQPEGGNDNALTTSMLDTSLDSLLRGDAAAAAARCLFASSSRALIVFRGT